MAPLSREKYEERHKRLIWANIAQFVLIVMIVGVFFAALQSEQRARCEELRERTVVTNQLLPRIVGAAQQDNDSHTAAFWNAYLVQLRENPLPQC